MPADRGEIIAETLEGLKHKSDLTIGDHGPDRFIGIVSGDRHGQGKTQEMIEIQRSADVFYKEVG